MDEIDIMIEKILNKMGVDQSQPPHWIQKMYKSKSILEYERPDGYTCSYCGKHSYLKKEKCDGCNSIMVLETDLEGEKEDE